MEKGAFIGIGSGLVLVYSVSFLGGGADIFFDPRSILIVVGGTISALCVTHSIHELKTIPAGLKSFISFRPPELTRYLSMFTAFARSARREGLLALDRSLNEDIDDFVRFGLEMAIDGIEESEIDELMRMRIAEESRRNGLTSKFFMNAGTYAPAFGMIGTLIGLIQMMQHLDDPSQIGAGMAIAVVTTFYGALLANLVFLPVGLKVKTQSKHHLKAMQMIRTGVLSIVRGESPSMIATRLQSFLDIGNDEDTGKGVSLKKAA